MTSQLAWGLVIGMAVSNIIIRWVPIALLSRLELPDLAQRWLGYIPVSVMAAIVATQVLRPGGQWMLAPDNPYLLAAVPTALVYRFTRSFLGATATGMLSFLALRYLLG
ncbi:MAG TPA: AzlD domain-containing protein [Coriobacteriia bacterium]